MIHRQLSLPLFSTVRHHPRKGLSPNPLPKKSPKGHHTVRFPSKVSTKTGDKDLLLLNDYMRDELDNTAGLIKLLENGGMARVTRATRKEDEDTFLLGPDLVAQLKKKMDIMRKHWLDASKHMATPFK